MTGEMGEVTHALDIDAADEHFHARSDHPHWNESGWFGVVLPERRTTIYVYFFHRQCSGARARERALRAAMPIGQRLVQPPLSDFTKSVSTSIRRWEQP